MSSTSDGRVFPEEESPTGKFANEQLDVLLARSLEKSTVFNASLDGPPVDAITVPFRRTNPPPRAPSGPTPSSPEFLGKGPAVLVLPPEPEPAPAPAPPARVEVIEPPPAAAAAPPPRALALVVRTQPRISTHPATKPRRRVWRHVVKLALLALVVVCQPWWWNVGDLNAHRTAPLAATK
jgi:hypothetical protein